MALKKRPLMLHTKVGVYSLLPASGSWLRGSLTLCEGPCSVYLKKVNAFSDQASGAGWFKIWHYGYENGKFCTEVLRERGGMMSVTIPQDLEGSVCPLTLLSYPKALDPC